MNQSPDPLEAELSALKPHDVSPELRRRIGQSLANSARRRRPSLLWLALGGGLAAACLAAIYFRSGGWPAESSSIVIHHQGVEAEHSWPTLLACQRALARSPEELDALLASHALAAPEPNPRLVRIGALTHSDAALHALLGED